MIVLFFFKINLINRSNVPPETCVLNVHDNKHTENPPLKSTFFEKNVIFLATARKSNFRDLAEIATNEAETQPLGPVFDVEQEYTNET